MRSKPLSKISNNSFSKASKIFCHHNIFKLWTLNQTFLFIANLDFKPSALDFKPTASFIVKTLDFKPRVFFTANLDFKPSALEFKPKETKGNRINPVSKSNRNQNRKKRKNTKVFLLFFVFFLSLDLTC